MKKSKKAAGLPNYPYFFCFHKLFDNYINTEKKKKLKTIYLSKVKEDSSYYGSFINH